MLREINLLPPDFKTERFSRRLWQGVGRLLQHVDVALLLVALMFGGLYATLLLLRQQVATAQQQENQLVYEQINQANIFITALHERSLAFTPWTVYAGEVLRLLPATLLITELRVDDAKQALMIEGVSRQREAVVAFERAVGALPWVAKVDSPLQNFATTGNSSFSLIIMRRQPTP